MDAVAPVTPRPGPVEDVTAMGRLRVCLADDHRVFVQALAARLRAEPYLELCGAACDRDGVLRLVAAARPDVLVLDLMLGEDDGVDLLPVLLEERPDLRVLMLSVCEDVGVVAAAVRAGARGWVTKTVDAADLVSAIRAVGSGGAWFPPLLLRQVLDRLVQPTDRSREVLMEHTLTPREREVLQYLVDGMARKEIASALFLSENTVRAHIQNLLSKLDAHSRAEAVALALRLGMRPSDRAVQRSDRPCPTYPTDWQRLTGPVPTSRRRGPCRSSGATP